KAVEYNYGIILKVHASVLPGYTGTPVLTVDGKSYSADASHEVVADALFATETRDLVLTFARNDDVTWMFNGINRGTQATVQTAFGSVIDVRVQAAGGYAGTTSIFANGSPYTENNVRVIGDVTFTAKTDSSGSTDDGTQSFKVVLGSKLGYALSAYGGSTSPVPYGGSFSFVIVAHDGYSLSDIAVRVNGNAVVLTNGSYTIRNIVGDQVVEVASVDGPSAQPDKVTVELSSESGISFQYSVNGGTFQDYVLPFDVDKGSTVTIRATGMEEGKLPLWPDGSRSEEYVYVASADLRSPIALTSEDPGDGSSNTVTIIAAAAAIAVIAIVSTLFFRMRRVP
ncbi:MAG: hypothetical protein LBS92_02255, partial [Candidatus Methanoplasma sp.]|nr:hypothetical protein [Candidatus Methanoplasma sp.]